jgi:hypothetical protein
MATERGGELAGTLVREEQPGSLELNDVGGAWDGIQQPVGPLAGEILIIGAPDDQCRNIQASQSGFDGEKIAGADGSEQAQVLTGSFSVGIQRFDPGPGNVVRQTGGIPVASAIHASTARRTPTESRREPSKQPAGDGLVDSGQQMRQTQASGGHIVMCLAIGQRKGMQSIRVVGGEHLGDGPAGVVGDQVDIGEFERVATFRQKMGEARQRKVLPGGARRLAMERKVNGQTSALPGELANNVSP